MTGIQSFSLPRGTRIANYRILKTLGRGYEGEVFKVMEVPTGAIRALKLFRTKELESLDYFFHLAQYYEQLHVTGHFPIYYHFDHWSLDKSQNCCFLIFEYIEGPSLQHLLKRLVSKSRREQLFFQLLKTIATVHGHGIAIGDFSGLEDILLTKSKRMVFIDCEPGETNRPNTGYKTDCQDELPYAATRIFGRTKPRNVRLIMEKICSKRLFNRHTLRRILNQTHLDTQKS